MLLSYMGAEKTMKFFFCNSVTTGVLDFIGVMPFRTTLAVYHTLLCLKRKVLDLRGKIRMILLLLHQHELHITLGKLKSKS